MYYSFCTYTIGSSPSWVGIGNFFNLAHDASFGNSILVTLQYVVIGVPLKLVFALLIAMLLTKPTRMQGFYRAVYYIPSLIGGSVAVALVWKQLFGSRGPVVTFIKALGVKNFSFFGSTMWAFAPLVLCNAWQFGSSMLIFLSSLKQIPRELYEAADVDGATKFHQFWTVTLPLLTPTIFFNLVQQTINSFLAFTQSKLITNGAPRNSTLFYTVYQYNKAFPASGKSQMGYASALAWIMLAIVSTVTILLFWTRKKWVYDG